MRTFPLVLLLAAATPLAHADVYKCVDGDGRLTYTNNPTSSRGCTLLSTEQPVSSVPAPARAPQATTPPTFPRVAPDTQRARDDTRRQVLQKELTDEQDALAEALQMLAEEEKRDAPEDRNVRRTTQDGRSYSSINPAKTEARLQPFRDKVELHQRNVEALQREIGGLK
jgi:hypothetical protein